MPLTLVMAVRGVGLEDVAVTTFQLFQDGTFVDGTGANVIGESRKYIFVTPVFFIQLTEFGIVAAK